MKKIEDNWKKYFKSINLQLKNSPSEKQFNRDVISSGKSLDFDSTVFTDEYYTIPYKSNPDDSATEQYNLIKKMFKNISYGSILCIKNNENNIKKIFYVAAIDYPRKEFKDKLDKQGKQNAYARILLKYYDGNNQFENTEGVYTYSIFPKYPEILGIGEDYQSIGGYEKYKYPHIDNAFKNDDNKSKNYFNIFDLRLMINQNKYSFNLITTEGQMYIGKQIGTYEENKEFLIDEDYK